MDTYRFLATALVVGIIGPLFWLGVNVIDGWVQRKIYPRLRVRFPRTTKVMDRLGLLGKQVGSGQACAPTQKLSSARRIGENGIRR